MLAMLFLECTSYRGILANNLRLNVSRDESVLPNRDNTTIVSHPIKNLDSLRFTKSVELTQRHSSCDIPLNFHC